MKKIKDTDYLYASSRIRVLEKGLLTRDMMTRMCDAKTIDEAEKILVECGYVDFNPNSLEDLERALATERTRVVDALVDMTPDKNLIEIFMVKYDYHNIKSYLKAVAMGEDYLDLMIKTGLIPIQKLVSALQEEDYSQFSPVMAKSIAAAKQILADTRDPQKMDAVLDKACYAEMLEFAQNTGSSFLTDYVKLLIDSANLRAAIRLTRMGREISSIKEFVIDGGNISIDKFMVDLTPDAIERIYDSSLLKAAAEAGGKALKGEEGLSRMDLLCDDAVMAYLKKAKYVSFGEQPVVAFIAAKESELTAVRTIMAGRLAGLKPEMIMGRLREAYV